MAAIYTWRGLKLVFGRRLTGFEVMPDPEWPKMFRVKAPDGTLSDVVNLTRAKDAAAVQAERCRKQRCP